MVVPGNTSFSATGAYAACLFEKTLKVYEVHSQREMLSVELIAPFSDWQFHWSNAGTEGAVILFEAIETGNRVSMAKGNMLDHQLAQQGLQAMTQIRLPDLSYGRHISLSTGHSRIFLASDTSQVWC